ncbi:MAG: hypothetical protein KDK40_05650, partial [Chlamydiia bacterium]|nr:hypothetical protein [Chlamydiia bacterium]
MPIALKILPALSETKSKEDLPPLPWPQVDICLLIPNPSPFESTQITCTVPKWGLKITGVLSEFSYAYSENVEQEISKEVERCYPVTFYQT